MNNFNKNYFAKQIKNYIILFVIKEIKELELNLLKDVFYILKITSNKSFLFIQIKNLSIYFLSSSVHIPFLSKCLKY